MIKKHLINNENEFEELCKTKNGIEGILFDLSDYPPISFPCLLTVSCIMDIYEYDYVYLFDFNLELCYSCERPTYYIKDFLNFKGKILRFCEDCYERNS